MPCTGQIMLILMVISILWGNTTILFWLQRRSISLIRSPRIIFQHDNACLHTARVTQIFSSNRISMLRNDHIKHQICIIWDELDHCVNKKPQIPKRTSTGFNTRLDIQKAIMSQTIVFNTWLDILKAIMSQTIVSLHELRYHIQAMIKVNIGHIMDTVLNININCILKDNCVVRCVS